MISRTQRLLWAGLLAGATTLAANAQTPTPAPATGAAPAASAERQGGPRMQHRDPAKRMEQMQQRRAERLAALKEKLKLDAAQESAWSSFAAAQQPTPRTGPRPDRAEFAKLSTPQRLDLMQQRQAERAAAFAKRADATRSFYAALKPEQQKTFDAESLPRFGAGGPRGHHGPHEHQPAAPAKS
jgi:hypothetical protein